MKWSIDQDQNLRHVNLELSLKYLSYLVSVFYLEGIISTQIGGNYLFYWLELRIWRNFFPKITLPNELLIVVNLTSSPTTKRGNQIFGRSRPLNVKLINRTGFWHFSLCQTTSFVKNWILSLGFFQKKRGGFSWCTYRSLLHRTRILTHPKDLHLQKKAFGIQSTAHFQIN